MQFAHRVIPIAFGCRKSGIRFGSTLSPRFPFDPIASGNSRTLLQSANATRFHPLPPPPPPPPPTLSCNAPTSSSNMSFTCLTAGAKEAKGEPSDLHRGGQIFSMRSGLCSPSFRGLLDNAAGTPVDATCSHQHKLACSYNYNHNSKRKGKRNPKLKRRRTERKSGRGRAT